MYASIGKGFLFFISVACLAFFFATTTSAQTSCLKFPSNSTAPAGYGASWDVTSTLKELLIKSNCPPSGNNLNITIGRGSTAQFIWSTIYVYGGSSWTDHTLAGVSGGEGWLIGIGNKTITTPFSPTPANPLFFVGYVCTPSGSSWKCGCANASCATKHWQIQGYLGLGGGGGGTGGGQPVGEELALCYPQNGLRTVPATPGDLAGKISGARAGDHIILSGGSYSGFTYSKTANEENPIVIKPAAGETVTITGRITMAGSYGVIAGLNFSSSGRIELTGHHNRITRNSFSGQNVGGGGIIETEGDGIHHNRIDHNSFQNFTGAAFRSDGWSNDGATDNQGSRVDHNYFKNHTVGGGNESVVLMLGDAYTDALLLYDYNLFDDVLNEYETIGQAELVSIKTSATTFRNNTIVNSSPSIVSLRQTNGSLIENNYLEDAHIRVHGDDHVIKGNKVTGGKIIISGGDGTMDTRHSGCDKSNTSPVLPPPNCKPVHAAARNTLVTDNIGSIVVGETGRGNVPSQHTTLRNNSGSITRDNDQDTEVITGSPNNSATKLQLSDVGVNASDPTCQ